MMTKVRNFIAAVAIGIAIGVGWPVQAQSGPYSAQIQRALVSFVLSNHTWSSTTQTFADIVIGNNILWSSDGNGNIGDVAATGRPNNVYVKTGVYTPFLLGGTANNTLLEVRSTSGDCSGTPTAIATKFTTGANGGTIAWDILCSGMMRLNNPTMTGNGQLIINAAQGWTIQSIGNIGYGAFYAQDGTTRRGYVGLALGTVDLSIQAETGFLLVGGSSGVKVAAPLITTGSGLAVANVGANSCGTTAASIAGSSNALVITVGATSGTQCRVAFPTAAPTEWDCAGNDSSTTTAVRTTPVDTTHTDFIGTFTAADKVTGICLAR